ncbi:MAG TPA: sulfatase [Methylomirabilota bacterium]|nr:sulfatase [Methylomirabilota bacterium]
MLPLPSIRVFGRTHACEARQGARFGGRANPLRATLAWAVVALLCLAARAVHGAETPPNIILIFADDLGYGDLGCYGAKNIRTPNIDRLAKQGRRFTSFYVAQPVCTASRAALMTGAYANRVGLSGALNHVSKTGISRQEQLMSEVFKGRGYATAAYGKWHLGHHMDFWPTRRGFDEFFGIPYSNDNGPLHPVTKGMPPLPLFEGEKVIEQDPDQAQFTSRITEKALQFIARNKERPFFLYLPHIMPHVPIFASANFKGKSAAGLYGDAVEELDWSVGQVLQAVGEHGLSARTLIIFTSDNGPFLSYGEHAGSAGPLREGKLTTFEGGVRTPFIASWPGKIKPGTGSSELITAMDLLPTFASLIKAPALTNKIDGLNLAPLLLGARNAKGRDTFWYYGGTELHAVRQGKWKLHFPHEYLTVAAEPGRNGKPSNYDNLKPLSHTESGLRGIASRHGYRVEKIGLSLFDLEADPSESRNLVEQHPTVVRRLQRVAEQARQDLGDDLTGAEGTGRRPVGLAAGL